MDSDHTPDAGPPPRVRTALDMTSSDSVHDHRLASRTDTPLSSLLHGLLHEKKADNRRMSMASGRESSDTNTACVRREIQSSPLGPAVRSENTRKSGRASDLGIRSVSVPKVMGLRGMEEVKAYL